MNEGKFNTLDPRLTIIKNGKVVLDSIYDWRQIQSHLIPTMMKNLGIEVKTIK